MGTLVRSASTGHTPAPAVDAGAGIPMSDAPTPYLLALTTCPDRETAEALGAALVERRLAACASVVQGVTSIYAWEGRVHRDAECLLLIKTRGELFDTLRDEVVSRHPYELPEILAVSVAQGLEGYLRWIDQSVDLDR